MAFLLPDDIVDARDVHLEAQLPDEGVPLATNDAARPKLWYSPVAAEATATGVRIWYQRVDKDEKEYADQRTLCLGELRDGQWVPTPLHPGPLAWGGVNNMCMTRSPHKPTWGGFNVFQIVLVEGRYRMLYWDQPPEGEAGAMLASSPDGRLWEKDPAGAVFTEHNDAFTLLYKDGEYLLYQTALEDWPEKPYPDNLDKKRRVQALRVSKDLRTWTPQAVFLRPDEQDKPETEFYLLKVFSYGPGYVGLLMKYYGDPNRPNQHSAILKTELIVSADARQWRRPFRNTDLGFWTYADPVLVGNRLHFVVGKDGAMSTVAYGSTGLTAAVADEDGTFTSRPFTLPKDGLALDASAPDGWIETTLLDAAGRPVSGPVPCRMDGVLGQRLPLNWPGADLTSLAGTECRLRFRLHRAKVFAVTAPGG